MSDIDLRCQDVRAMIASLPDGCAAFIHSDPPWLFRQGKTSGFHAAARHYDCLTDAEIAEQLAASARLGTEDAYLAVWCIFPKLLEWTMFDPMMRAAGWNYVSGGAWGKQSGLGVGYHFRGDAELLLLYKKGNMLPKSGSKTNLWLSDRLDTHSEKPQTALRTLVAMGADKGELVVDLYAGESASLARACQALNRRYVGAELDPARHARALVRLSQQEMRLEATA